MTRKKAAKRSLARYADEELFAEIEKRMLATDSIWVRRDYCNMIDRLRARAFDFDKQSSNGPIVTAEI